MTTKTLSSILVFLLFGIGCSEEELGYAPIDPSRAHDDEESSSSSAERDDACPAYINCREACGENDGGCRLECRDVTPTAQHEECVHDRCAELGAQCAWNDEDACVLLPRCDDDVEDESTSTDDTGESSSGSSTETGELGSSDDGSSCSSGTTGDA